MVDFTRDYDITPLFTEEEITARIAELGEQITERFRGQKVVLICILKGSLTFTAELAKRVKLPMNIDFMQVSSYGGGTTSGQLIIKKELDDPNLAGQNVIIVEDIIDTGRTLKLLMEELNSRENAKPATLSLCTLLDKPDRRVEAAKDVKVDFTGFQIPDRFVVGYGLDYDQRFRNLPYIGYLDPETL